MNEMISIALEVAFFCLGLASPIILDDLRLFWKAKRRAARNARRIRRRAERHMEVA